MFRPLRLVVLYTVCGMTYDLSPIFGHPFFGLLRAFHAAALHHTAKRRLDHMQQPADWHRRTATGKHCIIKYSFICAALNGRGTGSMDGTNTEYGFPSGQIYLARFGKSFFTK